MSAQENTSRKRKANWLLVTILLVGMAGGGLWYYQKSQQEILNLGYQLREMQSSQEATVHLALATRDSTWLHLLAEPLSWVVRQELLVDNVEQIHRYLAQYVKHESIDLMVVTDHVGQIISATDKNLEGLAGHEILSQAGLATDEILIIPELDHLNVYVPLMGFDKKIGNLYFKHQTMHTEEP